MPKEMVGTWRVDIDALLASAPVKALKPEEQQRAVKLAGEISLELSAETLKSSFGERSAQNSYEVKSVEGGVLELTTKEGDALTFTLNNNNLTLKSKAGTLDFKRAQ
jgi:hypothetical protein